MRPLQRVWRQAVAHKIARVFRVWIARRPAQPPVNNGQRQAATSLAQDLLTSEAQSTQRTQAWFTVYITHSCTQHEVGISHSTSARKEDWQSLTVKRTFTGVKYSRIQL